MNTLANDHGFRVGQRVALPNRRLGVVWYVGKVFVYVVRSDVVGAKPGRYHPSKIKPA